MIKDPLTKKQKQEFLELFIKSFYENYNKALKSGALKEEDFGKGDHTIARAILVITAHKFEPITSFGKETLKNLELFV